MPQIPIDRILLATDFSPGSTSALPFAIAAARRFRSKLYLAHVVPADAYSLIPLNERDSAIERMRTYVEEQMSRLRAMSLLNEVAHEVLIDHGEIWPMLSSMLEKYDVDLLVIGTHGRRGIEKLLLGSTAEEILRLSQRPVLMVGPESSAPAEPELELQRILHATDFSPESKPAMHCAYSIAERFGASLALVHVAEDIWQEPLSTQLGPEDFFRERMLERNWRLEEDSVEPECYVKFGPRADCILEIAAKLKSELIVMGLRGVRYPRIAAHLPGPTAYDVVTRAQCPVLVIRGEIA